MSINDNCLILYDLLSSLLSRSGIVFSAINLGLQFNNANLDSISIIWNCTERISFPKMDPGFNFNEIEKNIAENLRKLDISPSECCLSVYLENSILTESAKEHFKKKSKNCRQSSKKIDGIRISIQLLSSLIS